MPGATTGGSGRRARGPYSAMRITSSGAVASFSRLEACFTLTYSVLPSSESARLLGWVGVLKVFTTL